MLSVTIRTTFSRRIATQRTITLVAYNYSHKESKKHFVRVLSTIPSCSQSHQLLQQKQQYRSFSSYSSSRGGGRRGGGSRRGGGGNHGSDGAGSSGFKLDALPFSISPEEALDKFRKWSIDDQGLSWLISWNSIRIGAAYIPVWSFDLNIRYVVKNTAEKKKRYDWKPSVFADSYGSQQSVVHLPGLGSYAGYNYRRSLVHPIVNTTLVFMGEQTVPFERYMLNDMRLAETGERIEINPDPWNASRAQAFSALVEDLETIAAADADLDESSKVQVQTEIVSSRRVYMPMYLIDYSVLGLEYRAFTSGCDSAAGVSGVDHRVFGDGLIQPTREMNQASQNFLSSTWSAAQNLAKVSLRTLNGRQLFAVVAFALQFVGSILGRVLVRIPPIAVLGSVFVGFRKIIQPWMESQRQSAEWERQREHEAQMGDSSSTHSFGSDFFDNGDARRYFYKHKEKILEYLGGSDAHEQGDFDWYKDYEEWARRQWQQQQQQQQQTYQGGYGQQQQQRQRTQRKGKTEFVWDFDPNDPYSVLGIDRSATKSDVSAAFRKQMLKHHPDTQAGATEAEKLRASERSKLITEAYRTIKTSMKR